ncbi:hypothetical protein AAKU55_000055 [Oxalobacteraceae bacterium GrIS 1.11]
MRDKKDNATFDLPGFGAAPAAPPVAPAADEPKRAARIKKASLKQVQLELLDPTDASGLPVWRRDDNTDLTGLPNWAPA